MAVLDQLFFTVSAVKGEGQHRRAPTTEMRRVTGRSGAEISVVSTAIASYAKPPERPVSMITRRGLLTRKPERFYNQDLGLPSRTNGGLSNEPHGEGPAPGGGGNTTTDS